MINKHKLNRFLIKCGLHILAIAGLPTITTSPVFGAERVALSSGPLEFSVSVDSLETYAEDGIVDGNLATYTRGLTPNELTQLRQVLTHRLELSSIEVSQLLYSSSGETALQFLGELIQTDARQHGFYALRSALILAAEDPEGLTLLNVIKQFPTPTVRINSSLALQMVREFTQLFEYTNEAIALVEQQSTLEASDQAILQQDLDLGQPGLLMWKRETLVLNDQRRDRQFVADLYLPNLPQPAPVMVISHGLGSDRASFAYLAKHLTSHGFAVAVLEHPNSNAQQVQNLLSGLTGEVTEAQEFIDRPEDVSYLLDELEQLNQSSPTIQGQLSLQQVGVIGHSLGGYTALALAGAELNLGQLQPCNSNVIEVDLNATNPSMLLQCLAANLPATATYDLKDDRIQAVFAINPISNGIFGESGLQPVQVPTLFVAGSEDVIAPPLLEQICPFSWLTTPDKYLALIQGGTHTYFDATAETPIVSLVTEAPGVNLDIARNYLNMLSLAFAKTYIADQPEYKNYLSAAYTQSVSQPLLPLTLVQSLTTTQLSQELGLNCPNAFQVFQD